MRSVRFESDDQFIVPGNPDGYLGSEWSGFPVKFFGFTLPSWAGKNAALKDLTSTIDLATSWVIAAIVVLHVGAVLKHTFVDHSRLLARMGIGSPLPSGP